MQDVLDAKVKIIQILRQEDNPCHIRANLLTESHFKRSMPMLNLKSRLHNVVSGSLKEMFKLSFNAMLDAVKLLSLLI